MSILVIVESPNKTQKIAAILGSEYRVMASFGHVRDLPKDEMGVKAPDYKPHYETGARAKATLKKLRAEVRASSDVLLATDPDREGEAIAWHLADVLGLRNAQRIVFREITETAVQAAVKSPRPLDMALVHAQEARRVLDRLVGYTVSPVISQAAGQTLSAGRVQSPTVRLIVDRDAAIKTFKVTDHFTVRLKFANGEGGKDWTAEWDTKPHLEESADYLTDRDLTVQIAAVRDVRVLKAESSQSRAAPKAPFTTSTLQQAAQASLGFKTAATMELAQRLFEAGAITYHRTDAPTLSNDGYSQLAAFAAAQGLAVCRERRVWKAKEHAQEGHEAIRPTYVETTHAGQTEEEKKLYQLIRARSLASVLEDAVYDVRTLVLVCNDPASRFVARGRTLVSKGGWAIYDQDEDLASKDQDSLASDQAEATNPVPLRTKGELLQASDGTIVAKSTKPPARFKEGTLVAELERRGIGRPSTWASIIANIKSRKYIAENKIGFLAPGVNGAIVAQQLSGRFQFFDYDYTSDLENELDRIAVGKADYLSVVTAADIQLRLELAKLPQASQYQCASCSKPLLRRPGKAAGTFWWGCTGYPECKATYPEQDGKPGPLKVAIAPAVSDYHCPKCSMGLAHRKGVSAKGATYDFWACTGFPKCKANFQTAANGAPVLDQGARR
jgi:DNA topoisomerase-1